MNINLLGNKVLLAINPTELQEHEVRGAKKGKVVLTGPDVVSVAIGDRVFIRESEEIIAFNDKEYLIVLEDDILCTATL